MSVTLYIKSKKKARTVMPLVKSAIEAEIANLKLAIELAVIRLKPFEEKYQVPSEHFIKNMAAEDLEGGDDEFISWAGEYELKQCLVKKLRHLQEIKYDNTEIH